MYALTILPVFDNDLKSVSPSLPGILTLKFMSKPLSKIISFNLDADNLGNYDNTIDATPVKDGAAIEVPL